MKKTLLLAALIVTLVSCNKENNKNKPTFDPYTQLVLNSSDQTRFIPNAPYPIDTIIRYAFEIGIKYTNYEGEIEPSRSGISVRSLADRKLRVGQMSNVVDIDTQTGEARLGWFVTENVHDIVLLVAYHEDISKGWLDTYLSIDMEQGGFFADKRDTIGYVPNKSLFEAQNLVKEAFAKSDYDECMRLFEEAYTFIPITGAEYRKLEEQDLN